MDLLLAKILCGLVLWILSLCFGLMIPFLIWKSRANNNNARGTCNGGHAALSETDCLLDNNAADEDQTGNAASRGLCVRLKEKCRFLCRYDILSGINCLCGGLFLGILLLELLPESRQGVGQVLEAANFKTRFPVAEFMVACGLLVVMFIENIVSSTCARPSQPREYGIVRQDSSASLSHSQDAINCESGRNSHAMEEVAIRSVDSSFSSDSTRSLVLITMLSVHSIFEGLALGLEVSMSSLIELFIAISVHKSVMAFGLGMRLFESLAKLTIAVACIMVFCSASPIGCLIAIFMSQDVQFNSTTTNNIVTAPPYEFLAEMEQVNGFAQVSGTLIANAVLECLATGTFLYVTFIEVIPSEFSQSAADSPNHHTEELCNSQSSADGPNVQRTRKIAIKKVYKIVILLLGFAAVAGLQFV